MRKTVIGTLILILTVHLVQGINIKFGSIAPVRSPWDKALKEIAREWSAISSGKVRLKIYPGGIAGSERAMIRKMKIRTLNGALFSNVGLTSIYPDFYVMSIPLLFNSDEELNYVLSRIRGKIETLIEEKGYKVIFWSNAGWIKFFTKNPVSTPEEMKAQKLYFTTGEAIIENAWKKSGYNLFPTELKDLMMALQSGMVNAFFLPPLVAASGQYFALAPNMMSIRVSPIYGAAVVDKRIWQKVPEIQRDKMERIARKIAAKLDENTKKLEKEAIRTMIENGLKIVNVTDAQMKLWRREAQKNVDYLKGEAFSESIYNRFKSLITEFRNGVKSRK